MKISHNNNIIYNGDLVYFKKLMIASIFSLSSYLSHSQIDLNKTYDIGKSLLFRQIECSKDNKLIVNGVYTDTFFKQKVLSIILDSIGHVEILTEIADPIENHHLALDPETSFIVTSDNKSVIPIYFFARSTIGLAILSSTGGIEAIQEYFVSDNVTQAPFDIVELHDGFLVTGWSSRPPQFKLDAFVLKTDKKGNKIWLKEYGELQYGDYTRSICVIDSNHILLSGVKQVKQNGADVVRGWVFAIDSLGEMKWEWLAPESEIPNGWMYSMKFDRDHNELNYFTYVSRKTLYPDESYDVSIPLFVKRDTLMNLVSYESLGSYAYDHRLTGLERSRDGGWIGVGNTTRTTDDFLSPVESASGKLIKLTSDGTLQWTAIVTASYDTVIGSASSLSGVAESTSGSIYAVGWTFNYDQDTTYRGFGWIIKIGADGCIDTLCTTTSLAEQIRAMNQNVLLYPNPAIDEINISIKSLQGDGVISIFDLQGRCLFKQQISEGVTQLSPDLLSGVYIYSISDKRGIIYSGKLGMQ